MCKKIFWSEISFCKTKIKFGFKDFFGQKFMQKDMNNIVFPSLSVKINILENLDFF